MTIYIETLNITTWLFYILPYLIKQYLEKAGVCNIYYIDATKSGTWLAHLTRWLIGSQVQRLCYRLVDIKDNAGDILKLKITYFDLIEIQNDIESSMEVQKFFQEHTGDETLKTYLLKQAVTGGSGHSLVWRTLFLIRLAQWQTRRENPTVSAPATCQTLDGCRSTKSVLFLRKRLWMDAIKKYAASHNVEIKTADSFSFQLKERALKCFGPTRLRFIRNIVHGLLTFSLLKRMLNLQLASRRQAGDLTLVKKRSIKEKGIGSFRNNRESSFSNDNAHLAVEYYGHLNVNQPAMHSDLFFWQQAALDSRDILMMFGIPVDPLDSQKMNELDEHGVKAVALDPRASRVPAVSLFQYWPDRKDREILRSAPWPACHESQGGQNDGKMPFRNSPLKREQRWLNEQTRDFYEESLYWQRLFKRYNIKLFVSWFKYSAHHCVIAHALGQSRGLLALYQRAYEEFSSPETTVAADVVFGFSKEGFVTEQNSKSNISYYIVTGYLGDHRFPFVKEQAQMIRRELQNKGAKQILAFFDENSSGDSRWHTGHEFMRDNYAFLLQKVLEHPWLGLVIKPKQSSTFHQRLGKVNDLFFEAQKSGRVFMFQGGILQVGYPPAIAALAADIAVHGHLCAATAGIESALAGVPTLLLDREGWSVSKLYRLQEGQVVFKNWLDLWKRCEDHWRRPGGIIELPSSKQKEKLNNGFGDWSSLIDELDPFHDGHAARRMGTFLKWLLDGFNHGLPREMVLADAAQRYKELWGADKVFEMTNKFSILNDEKESIKNIVTA